MQEGAAAVIFLTQNERIQCQYYYDVKMFFYKAYIESVVTFCILAWFGNMTLFNKNRQGRLVKVASKIIGEGQNQLKDIFDRHVLRKDHAVLDCPQQNLTCSPWAGTSEHQGGRQKGPGTPLSLWPFI